MLGYNSRDDLMGSNAKTFYYNLKDREEHINLLHEEKFIKNRRLALRKKDGTKIWVSLSASEIINEKTGELDYMEGTIIDISELILMQELFLQF